MRANSNDISAGGGAQTSSRVIGIDILRIALALVVFMFHSKMHIDCSYFILNPFLSVGAIVMTGFFMLSGYSLRLVYGEQNIMEKGSLRRFYINRLFGVLPLYYIVAFLYIILIGDETLSDNFLLLPIETLGLQSTFSSLSNISHNGGTWFISCLLLSYVLYPFLQSICKMLRFKNEIILLLVIIVIDIWATIVSMHFKTAGLYANPFYRTIEFACGLILADLNIRNDYPKLNIFRDRKALITSIIFFVGGVSIMRYYLRIDDYMQYNWLALPCFSVMLLSLGTIKIPLLENVKSIGYLGKISYAFFLSQFFVWTITRIITEWVGYDYNWLRISLSLVLCLLISIIMYEVVQRPIEKYIKPKILAYV